MEIKRVVRTDVIFFLGYLFLAHLALPLTEHKSDLFLINSWDLYSFNVRATVRDFTWDSGKTYLLRDYRTEALKFELDLLHLLKFTSKSKTLESFPDHLIESVKEFCKCDKIVYVTLKGSQYDHYILKRNLETIGQDDL